MSDSSRSLPEPFALCHSERSEESNLLTYRIDLMIVSYLSYHEIFCVIIKNFLLKETVLPSKILNVRKAAIFDIDGTILKDISSERVFFFYLLEKKIIKSENLLQFADAFIRNIFSLKGLYVRKNKYYLKNIDYQYIAKNICACFEERICPHISEIALREIERLKNDGYMVILLSGTLSPLVDCVTKYCNADLGIGTQLAIDSNGIITGEIDGIHSYSGGKETVMNHLVSQYNIDLPSAYAYGNAYVDIKFMRMVGNPIAVNADMVLWCYAKMKQWKIVEF